MLHQGVISIDVLLLIVKAIAYTAIAIVVAREWGRTPWALILAHIVVAFVYVAEVWLSMRPVVEAHIA